MMKSNNPIYREAEAVNLKKQRPCWFEVLIGKPIFCHTIASPHEMVRMNLLNSKPLYNMIRTVVNLKDDQLSLIFFDRNFLPHK